MAPRLSSSFVRFRRGSAVLAALALLLTGGRALAQDHQAFQLGNGLPDAECVSAGPNTSLDSTPVPDDAPTLSSVLAGANGICETPLSGDDVRPPNGITLGTGVPNGGMIIAGPNGVCDDAITPLGDDVVRVPAGQSEPRQVAITAGANLVIDSTAGGDDVSTAVVCPGTDGVLDSAGTVNPADLVVVNNLTCSTLCGESQSCIIPGVDDVLQSTAAPQDVTVFYVSSGADGIAHTAASGGDSQRIPVGSGLTELTTVCVSSGPDGIAQTTLCGNGIDDIEENGISPSTGECDDGDTTSGNGCSAICLVEAGYVCSGQPSVCTLCATACGDGTVQSACGEQCDDGGVIGGDGCSPTCKDEFCGDGVNNNNGSEECDDGNNRNTDGCVQGCQLAACGDGFKQTSVEECDDGCLTGVANVCEPVDDGDGCSSACVEEPAPGCGNEIVDPGEDCDDGNNSNRDDCLNTCVFAACGDGRVHDQGTGTETCDDDNIAPGDGCSPTCALECGNGVIDGACSEGNVGAPCSTNPDCDTLPGNGVCIGEQCDPGKNCVGGSNAGAVCTAASACPGGTCASLFCVPGPGSCSGVCLTPTCGNGAVECGEQCDLGGANGVVGSGCTATCQRNLVGNNEVTGSKECPSAWTLDSAPQDLRNWRQECADGTACDFDGTANGRCTFRVGMCLNRPAPAGCIAGGIQSLDLQPLKFRGICSAGVVGGKCLKSPFVDNCETSPGANDGICLSREADAAAAVTDAVRLLAPSRATVPDRCRAGLKGKICSITDDDECDRVFGGGGGLCDVGAGVQFSPPIGAGDQATSCTPSVDVVVDAGTRLKLFSKVRRTTGPADIDKLMLVCAPPP